MLSKIKQILSKEQLDLFNEWCSINQIDKSSIEIVDDYLHGIVISGKTSKNNEYWSIDFVL